MAVKYSPNCPKVYIFHSKALHNIPELGFWYENKTSGNPYWVYATALLYITYKKNVITISDLSYNFDLHMYLQIVECQNVQTLLKISTF
jgi:hypothetical protein